MSWQAGDADAALRWADAAAAYNPYYANGFAIGAQLAQSRGDATGANERLQRGLVFNLPPAGRTARTLSRRRSVRRRDTDPCA
ncbi:MAG: hypothetical protein R3E12_07290 [Candidatus Eisenbacteria bacterium]